ncbi:MerR family transcriptional regulator [Williamsia sterculiae]|uniref:MerR family transcriptional regulator n=1 Tax=Williamsia sterculiae TaxID=1344003 RepID=UPI001F2EAC17|nr:MerR family transcriptional regulator [Williamsia sterculiae]
MSENPSEPRLDDRHAHRSVGATARLVGVSVRTLHHYDHIGLVQPSVRGHNGYRGYTDADVARLHRVLVYREVGFGLEQIATLLDDATVDERAQLARQRHELLTRIDRLHHMVAAVEDMMSAQNDGVALSAEEQREIFGDDWLGEEYRAEAEERWGDTAAWAQSQQRTAAYSKADWQRIAADTAALDADLAAAMRTGAAPGSPQANALAERHRASIERFYDCDHSMQMCLGDMYVADPRFRAHYDDQAPGLAEYLRDVIAANAAQHAD